MINSEKRVGNFTSSGIGALMNSGTMATYIEEKNYERRLGRSLNSIVSAKPLSWGNLLEVRAFELLGLEYSLISKETIVHPEFNYWSGSPDGNKPNTVMDIKCPITLKSFCTFVECITMIETSPGVWEVDGLRSIKKIREKHKDGEKYYWQLVSNSILRGVEYAELIVYCPYKSELSEIRESCEEYLGDPKEVNWIAYANDEDLPYILDGGYYKNINVIRFKVPEVDKIALTTKVKLGALKLLTI
jgi:hypothetical protein